MLNSSNTQVVVLAPCVHDATLFDVVMSSTIKPVVRCPAELPPFPADGRLVRVNYPVLDVTDFSSLRHRAVAMVRDASNVLRRSPGSRLAVVNGYGTHITGEFTAALRYLDNRGISYDVINL